MALLGMRLLQLNHHLPVTIIVWLMIAAVALLFYLEGKIYSGLLTDTWEYNGVTWQQINVTQSPSQRKEMPLVYDQQRDSILFFGGGYWNGSLVTFNET